MRPLPGYAAGKTLVFSWIIIIFFPLNILSQQREIEAGMMFFKQTDYFNAVLQFNNALSAEGQLEETDMAKCYYFLAASRIYLYGQEAGVSPEETVKAAAGEELLKAYDELLKSLSHDDGTYTGNIDKQLLNIQPALEQLGIVMINQGNDAADKESREVAFKKASEYLKASLSIKETYLSHDLMGQVRFEELNYEEAITHFNRSIELYLASSPEKPDFLAGYTFYRLAVIYRYSFEDQGKALASIQDGLAFMNKDYNEWKSQHPGPLVDKALEEEYRKTKKDLERFELDIYLELPEKYQDALMKFREATVTEPGNYDLVTAYASLMEGSDQEQAIRLYEQAIQIDSTRELAYFNIAALYYSRGKIYYDEALTEKDDQRYKILAQSARENFLKSVPYFEKSLEINPALLESVTALKNIAFITDDNEKYLYYQELERSLEKQ